MRQLKWSALAAYLVLCLMVYPTLPDRVPFHFGGSGVVDAWAPRSLWVWLALPAFLALMLLLMDATTGWTVKHPQLWNVPEKRRFLAMTEQQRAPLYDELRNFMDVLGVAIVALFAVIQYLMYIAAVRNLTRFPYAFRIVTVVFAVGIISYAIRFSIRLRRIILSIDVKSDVGRMG